MMKLPLRIVQVQGIGRDIGGCPIGKQVARPCLF